MSTGPYGITCPIIKACEMLEPRWTIPILTEIWSGSSRFGDIRRGVGNISSALLSKRLKELQDKGLVERIEDRATGHVSYVRTDMAMDLEPALNALAVWAQRHIDAEIAASHTDLPALMWKVRREVCVAELPQRRVVIRFHFRDHDESLDTYWLVVRPGRTVELCTAVPGFDVDLYVETTPASMSSLLMARSNVAREVDRGHMFLSGDAQIAKTMDRWLPQSAYADVDGTALA
ncbi:MAG: helix-turn-helix domain-containing protein [Dinoroseobacter sp.]|nr:helix-turn-helix domain-containing protein [Dinoroseobacter sp.]